MIRAGEPELTVASPEAQPEELVWSSSGTGVDTPRFAVVVPTLGRPSLAVLLRSLATQQHAPDEVVVVDDRPGPADVDLQLTVLDALGAGAGRSVRVLRGHGRGPAHARNVGWQASRSPWVVFVDDDVVLPDDWSQALLGDLAAATDDVGGVQARIDVPLPADRRPTDWERGTSGLADAVWATAEMAYRREALVEVGGFDERFPRAYREDADLALRVRRNGFQLARGQRRITHPVRPSSAWASVTQQRGNRDDALMRRLHGDAWRTEAGCPPGRLRWHAATAASAAATLLAATTGLRRTATVAAAAWAALTADFAARRIAPGPRTPREVLTMVMTSVAIPPYAVAQRVLGTVAHRSQPRWSCPVKAVLLDRDGTLVDDVPYNGDPAQVRPVPGAREAVRRLREAGLAVGVVTNQSGIARGLLTPEQAQAVNARVDELVGPFDTWQVCPHGPDDGCECRKPAPGMVLAAAEELGVLPHEVVVIGDIGSDVEAARAAGARGVLVPTDRTLPAEVRRARHVVRDLTVAVDLVLERPS
ncbi:MAG TPA: HAD-IIIA family hydrolase [Actinomycetales bacterium]|nr:HAD-IIIA family hydrolase [Actinomycetales bacterium]